MDDDTEDLNSKRDRSPAVPYLGLTQSIELTRKLYQVARSSEVRLAQIAPHWNTTATSGALARYAGALQGYGLIESSGSKESRKIRISEDGRRILEDTRPGVAEALRSKAALSPKMFERLFSLWGRNRPADDIARSALQFDHNFTLVAATRFLKVFDEAISYVSGEAGREPAVPEEESPSFSGPLVDWDPGMDTRSPSGQAQLRTTVVSFDASVRRDVFALDEGEAVLVVPRALSRASFEDFSAWIELVRKKIERSVTD